MPSHLSAGSAEQVDHGIQDMLYLKDRVFLACGPLHTWQFTRPNMACISCQVTDSISGMCWERCFAVPVKLKTFKFW